jgi:WD40 repeat protein
MLSLNLELYKKCRRLLLQCSEFDDARSLESLFIINGLSTLRANLPFAHTKVDRVDKLIAYLLENESTTHEPYLLAFLKTLQNRREDNDLVHEELGELVSSISSFWQAKKLDVKAAQPVPEKQQYEDWGTAFREHEFFGRSKERALLNQWVVNNSARLVAVVGMGGVGKTTLAERVARDVREDFEYVFWRDLRNAPLPDDILTECILFLSRHRETNIPDSIEGKVQLLVRYLASSKCLIVLDNAETVLGGRENAGEFRANYEGYGHLLRTASHVENNSCIIMTTRETPSDFSFLENTVSGVYKLFLVGLDETSGFEILKRGNLTGSTNLWADLVNLYGGNPLALKLVAATIRDWFEGDIAKFLHHGTPVYGDIKDLLDEQLNRLSALGAEILFWLAIERETISLTDLESDIVYWIAINGNHGSVQTLKHDMTSASPVSKRSIIEAIDSLDRKSLIEKNQGRFTLQPVIMEHLTEKLVEEVFWEINAVDIKLLRSHAIIKAQSKEYVRLSQVRLVLEPLCQMLVESLGRKKLRNNLVDIINKARTMGVYSSGYIAGNVLNILANLGEPTSGFDFSDLEIRQAFLHNADLRRTDFAGARFKDTFFTEAFANVASVAVSSSLDLFAAGMGNGEVRVWQSPDWTQIASASFSNTWIRTLSFSPTKKLLAGSGDDGCIQVWDWENNFVIQSLIGHTDRIRSLAFTNDGNTIISGSEDGTVRFWDISTGECRKTLDVFHAAVRSISLSPDQELLAIGGGQNAIMLYDVARDMVVKFLEGHDKPIWRVRFNVDGSLLVTASEDKTIRIWETSTGQNLKIFRGHQEWVRDVAFNTSGSTLISCGDDQTVRVWDFRSGELQQSMLGHSNRVQAVGFVSGDGMSVVSGSDDHSIRIWDLQTGRCLKVIHGFTNPVWGCTFQPESTRLATGSADGSVRVWNVETKECDLLLKGHTKPVWTLQFVRDSGLLISGGDDGNILLWDIESGELVANLQGHKSWVRSIAVSHSGKMLASGGADYAVKLWDLESHRLLHTLSQHRNRVDAVSFNYRDDVLASGAEDNSIVLWDVKSGESRAVLDGHMAWVRSLMFSPTDDMLVSGSDDKTVRVWNINAGASETLHGHTGRVRAVAFNQDGKLIVSGGSDNVIRLWDVEEMKCISVLTGHTACIRSLSISSDGSFLASCGEDGRIIVWDMKTQEMMSQLIPERPYEKMLISGVKGLSSSQIASLRMLGAV